MLSANFKPKRPAEASRGFLATARLSCENSLYVAEALCFWVVVHSNFRAGLRKTCEYNLQGHKFDTNNNSKAPMRFSKFLLVISCNLVTYDRNTALALRTSRGKNTKETKIALQKHTFITWDMFILPRFRDIAGFLLRRATPPVFHPNFRGVSLGLDWRCCGSDRSEDPKLIIRVINFELVQPAHGT